MLVFYSSVYKHKETIMQHYYHLFIFIMLISIIYVRQQKHKKTLGSSSSCINGHSYLCLYQNATVTYKTLVQLMSLMNRDSM